MSWVLLSLAGARGSPAAGPAASSAALEVLVSAGRQVLDTTFSVLSVRTAILSQNMLEKLEGICLPWEMNM